MRAGGNVPPPGSVPQPRASRDPVIGERTLKIEAARAEVTPEVYRTRLRQGLLYCYRCQDWHPEDAFPADDRRHSGRAGSCRRAIRAAALEELAGRCQFPPPAAVWVIKRLESSPGPASGQPCSYWRGPGSTAAPDPDRPQTWSPALDEHVARFGDASAARDALIAAYGEAGAVPAGCRLVRLA